MNSRGIVSRSQPNRRARLVSLGLSLWTLDKVRMWERGCFLATIPEQLRRPCRPRDPYAVPRTSLQCVCTRRRNCIAQLSPSREYALRTVDFPARNSATIKLTHYPAPMCQPPPGQLTGEALTCPFRRFALATPAVHRRDGLAAINHEARRHRHRHKT